MVKDSADRITAEKMLKESERQLETLLSNLPGMAYRCLNDPDWTMLFVSDGAVELTGYQPEDLVSKRILYADIIHPDDRQNVWEQVQEAIRQELPFELEYRIRTAQGEEEKWVWEKGRGILSQETERLTLEGLVIDITDQKKLKSQFIQAQKMEAIGRLSGGVAHDFNNLLTSILGYGELMLDDIPDNDPSREFVEEIIKAGKSAASLIRQLLAFSRKQILELEVFDLNTEITGLKKMLQRIIGEDVVLDTFLESRLGKIKADRVQMQQVIMNLAVNARDAMPRGGKLTIETANVDIDETYAREHDVKLKPGPHVMLSISDTGVGMDRETQDKIFEPFFTTKEKEKGTGLGLSTVYGIIKQCNGYIWVYSEPGKGTTFKIYMPAAQTVAGPKKEKQVSPERLRGSETVLVVEDEQYVRKLLVRVLAQYGYTVLEAKNGEDALNLSDREKGRIHLMVTDVIMPGMSGRELADRLKATRPDMKVLFMSGYSDKAIVQHAILDRDVFFIQKPISPRALAQKVQQMLNSA